MRNGPHQSIIVGLATILGEVVTVILVLEALGRLVRDPASRRPVCSASVARARLRADPALSRRSRK